MDKITTLTGIYAIDQEIEVANRVTTLRAEFEMGNARCGVMNDLDRAGRPTATDFWVTVRAEEGQLELYSISEADFRALGCRP